MQMTQGVGLVQCHVINNLPRAIVSADLQGLQNIFQRQVSVCIKDGVDYVTVQGFEGKVRSDDIAYRVANQMVNGKPLLLIKPEDRQSLANNLAQKVFLPLCDRVGRLSEKEKDWYHSMNFYDRQGWRKWHEGWGLLSHAGCVFMVDPKYEVTKAFEAYRQAAV